MNADDIRTIGTVSLNLSHKCKEMEEFFSKANPSSIDEFIAAMSEIIKNPEKMGRVTVDSVSAYVMANCSIIFLTKQILRDVGAGNASDLVAELRDSSEWSMIEGQSSHASLLWKAANEIEALRARLKEAGDGR